MAKKQAYAHLSSLTAAIHFGFVLLYIACIFLMILSKELRFYAALFFCLIWIQQIVFKGCSLTRLEGYLLKKGGKKCDDIFFFNRFMHDLFEKKFRISINRLKVLFQGLLLFFVVVSGIVIILRLY